MVPALDQELDMLSFIPLALAGMVAGGTGPSPSSLSASTAPKAQKPVLIVLTSHAVKGDTGQPTGFYLSEVTHPLAVFERTGLKVEFASIRGGEPPVDGLKLDDAINARYWNDPGFRDAIRNTPSVDAVDPANYSAVLFAGGHGTMWDFADSNGVQRLARVVYESGGVVGAVCHGPAALVNVKLGDGRYLVDGKRLAAFTDEEERAVQLENVVPFLLASTLVARGATHVPAPNWQAQVVTDGRLVTGQNPASAIGVGEAMTALLRD
jgi:putative intracellular protease/amidase